MLEAVDLECVRGSRTLFSALNFSVRSGELLRIAGPNGSGKTSLLRILCGLLLPVTGAVKWKGADIRQLREDYCRELLYVGHASAVKDDLTPVENLLMAASLTGVQVGRAEAVDALYRLGLEGYESSPVKVLSQGQRRRVVLARLILGAASSVWIVAEPVTALDVHAVEEVRSLIASHLRHGGAVVLTTHQEVEIEAELKQRVVLGSRVH
jgi:heme exporter protein A